ncbi:MAG: hypothetical protein K0S81_703 [Rhodospirillales bacterium]|nr:hypothetical protein [Rhodospirillales bacterium]
MLCLLAGDEVVTLPLETFTLVWEHTVERAYWHEDWRVTAEGLVIDEARIQTNGAGMEAGEGAVLQDGWWRWRPELEPLPHIVLARSAAGEWQLCWAGQGCRGLAALVPGTEPVTLRPCGG